MYKRGFEGWYFKHQSGNNSIAFIPGISESGAFIQVIHNGSSHRYEINNLTVSNREIQAGNCLFSLAKIIIDLPDIKGIIKYGKTTPIKYDIMGPFRFFPMECKHGILSMSHVLSGNLQICGNNVCFDNGKGYIEKDSGFSFPKSYLWIQCNTFDKPCSFVLSIADIPFMGFRFTGCISILNFSNKEYRFATYKKVKILTKTDRYIKLLQRNFLLEIDLFPKEENGHELYSPIKGKMNERIRECNNIETELRLWEKGELILKAHSLTASYESASFER